MKSLVTCAGIVVLLMVVLLMSDYRTDAACNAPNDKQFNVVLHPTTSDFLSTGPDRVMISTKQDDYYHTSYQTSDRKLKIVAHLTSASAGSVANGTAVYFKVVDQPDPDDESPYETVNGVSDNKDTAVGAGILDPATGVVNANSSGDAEITLIVTDRCSGDNYQVVCSLYEDFRQICARTPVYVAWKRIYLRPATMYKRPHCRHLTQNANSGQDIISVNNAASSTEPAPFKVGDEVIIFDGAAYVERKITAAGPAALILNVTLGIDFKAGYNTGGRGAAVAHKGTTSSGFHDLTTTMVPNAFGTDTHGSVNGGCFVEVPMLLWNRTPNTAQNPGRVPQVKTLHTANPNILDPDDMVPFNKFSSVWCGTTTEANVVRTIAGNEIYSPLAGAAGGVSFPTLNAQVVASGYWDSTSVPVEGKAEVLVHELGHQFGGDLSTVGANGNQHVDQEKTYVNINGSDNCVMSYYNQMNGDCDFCATIPDADCVWDIRMTADAL